MGTGSWQADPWCKVLKNRVHLYVKTWNLVKSNICAIQNVFGMLGWIVLISAECWCRQHISWIHSWDVSSAVSCGEPKAFVATLTLVFLQLSDWIHTKGKSFKSETFSNSKDQVLPFVFGAISVRSHLVLETWKLFSIFILETRNWESKVKNGTHTCSRDIMVFFSQE
jgi:hypothetical protein